MGKEYGKKKVRENSGKQYIYLPDEKKCPNLGSISEYWVNQTGYTSVFCPWIFQWDFKILSSKIKLYLFLLPLKLVHYKPLTVNMMSENKKIF